MLILFSIGYYYTIIRSRYIPQPTSSGYLNYSCASDSDCNYGSCDNLLKVCKISDGNGCSSNYDCLNDSYCSGVCIPRTNPPTTITGIVGGYCPCFYNNQSCVDGVCKSTTVCNYNSDCVTGVCNFGTCSTLLSNGQYCSIDNECYSGNCSMGTCQQVNVTTGRIGSACNNETQCNDLLLCNNGFCTI